MTKRAIEMILQVPLLQTLPVKDVPALQFPDLLGA